MDTGIELNKSSVVMKKALLIYGPDGGYYDAREKSFYATIHDVTVSDSGRPNIEAGRGLTVEEAYEIFESIAGGEKLKMIDDRIIAKNSNATVFYAESKIRPTWIECEGEENKYGEVWHPGIIFVVKKTELYVYAYKGFGKPKKETLLYVAPYMNTRIDGSVCMGNRKLPSRKEENIDEIMSAFFTSSFTHALSSGLVDYEGGIYSLWFDLVGGKFADRFPEDCMVKAGSGNFTVEKMLRIH